MAAEVVYEIRTPPRDERLAAAARANCGGWVYDIDFEYAPDDAVPPEAIRGAWEVSEFGSLTGRYRPNGRHRPLIESDRVLKPYVHAAARFNPGKWISEIDPRAEHLFPNIPDECILGWWLVGKDGKITKTFRRNSLYTPT